MLDDPELRREVVLACLIARVVAVALPFIQLGYGLNLDLRGSIVASVFSFLSFVATPLVTGLGLYLLALIAEAVARLEVRRRVRGGRGE